jgi:putative RecB family exonuclease
MLEAMGVGKTKKVGLIYLAGPKVMSKEITEEELQETRVMIRTTKDKIDQYCEDEVFPGKPSRLCNWCHFKKICPEWVK